MNTSRDLLHRAQSTPKGDAGSYGLRSMRPLCHQHIPRPSRRQTPVQASQSRLVPPPLPPLHDTYCLLLLLRLEHTHVSPGHLIPSPKNNYVNAETAAPVQQHSGMYQQDWVGLGLNWGWVELVFGLGWVGLG